MAALTSRLFTADKPLSREQMREAVHAVVAGDANEAEVIAWLTAMHHRGETNDEIVGAALAMRELAHPLPDAPENAIDTCGTGGDGANTFNISTVAALVVAACDVPVAKHGNRAATSRCGSADLVEAWGIDLDTAPETMAACVEQVGIGFFFARRCHPAMARVAPIRAKIAHPTVFNRLGPLVNPMRVKRQLVGVGRRELMQPTLDALIELGASSVWVVHAEDGLDEISIAAPSQVFAYDSGQRRVFEIDPAPLVAAAPLTALRGGDAAENRAIADQILAGDRGPRRDAVLINAAASLVVAGCASDLHEGISLAANAIDTRRASDRLQKWKTALCSS